MSDTGRQGPTPRAKSASEAKSAKPVGRFAEYWDTLKTIVYAVVIALAVRTFAFEPFNIPSGSMIPTLLVGDYLFVAKYAYGYSRYSLPLDLPLFKGRILASAPERGDVMVFRLPRDPSIDYIKRIVGLPGDRIQVRGGVLYINDQEVKRERIEDFVDNSFPAHPMRVPQYIETMPNGRRYRVLDLTPNGPHDNTRVYTVPPGDYFAMGDNRDNSSDSRVDPAVGGVGFIPAANLIGPAKLIFYSTSGGARLWQPWKWWGATRFGRIFDLVE